MPTRNPAAPQCKITKHSSPALGPDGTLYVGGLTGSIFALDSRTGDEILTLFKHLRDAHHTVVLITHDAHVAAHADTVYEIFDGVLRRQETGS